MFKKKKSKYVAKYVSCHRCGEEHIDDPYYEHRCAEAGGLMQWVGQKPDRSISSENLTVEQLENLYGEMQRYRGTRIQGEVQRRMAMYGRGAISPDMRDSIEFERQQNEQRARMRREMEMRRYGVSDEDFNNQRNHGTATI